MYLSTKMMLESEGRKLEKKNEEVGYVGIVDFEKELDKIDGLSNTLQKEGIYENFITAMYYESQKSRSIPAPASVLKFLKECPRLAQSVNYIKTLLDKFTHC
jgi:hypothetical protein